MASYRSTPKRPKPHAYFSIDGFACAQCQLPSRNSVHQVAQEALPSPVLDVTGRPVRPRAHRPVVAA